MTDFLAFLYPNDDIPQEWYQTAPAAIVADLEKSGVMAPGERPHDWFMRLVIVSYTCMREKSIIDDDEDIKQRVWLSTDAWKCLKSLFDDLKFDDVLREKIKQSRTHRYELAEDNIDGKHHPDDVSVDFDDIAQWRRFLRRLHSDDDDLSLDDAMDETSCIGPFHSFWCGHRNRTIDVHDEVRKYLETNVLPHNKKRSRDDALFDDDQTTGDESQQQTTGGESQQQHGQQPTAKRSKDGRPILSEKEKVGRILHDALLKDIPSGKAFLQRKCAGCMINLDPYFDDDIRKSQSLGLVDFTTRLTAKSCLQVVLGEKVLLEITWSRLEFLGNWPDQIAMIGEAIYSELFVDKTLPKMEQFCSLN